MDIYLYSLTGNGKKFLKESGIKKFNVVKNNTIVNKDFILITNTIGFGEVPLVVEKFLEKNHSYCKGVVSGGNRNWGENFAVAADLINEKYPHIPILMKIELNGTKEQREDFSKLYSNLSKKNE